MQTAKRELRMSHTRENVCVCDTCDVLCTVYTLRRLQGNRPLSLKQNSCKHSKKRMFVPFGREHHVDDPLQSVEDEADEDHEFHPHCFSILDVGDFVGWQELENRPFDHLFVLGHGSF